MHSSLLFDHIEPVAPEALGGLGQDHFCNSRVFASVAAHGGLGALSYWGRQHLRAQHFFRGDTGTAWNRLFRLTLVIEGRRYYPLLKNTRLLPFGYVSEGAAAGIVFRHELLLLPDALVQRVVVIDNPAAQPVGFEILHQEAVTAVNVARREWTDFTFDAGANALLAACTDERVVEARDEALAQAGFDVASKDTGKTTTWIGAGGDARLTASRGYHSRSKHYLRADDTANGRFAFHVVFAPDESSLRERLRVLSAHVHDECDALLAGYERRLAARPRVHTHSAVLDSAFAQYPELIHCLTLADRPGAVRATASGYFLWGWDGLTPLLSSPLANDAPHAAAVLRFYHATRDPEVGIPHQFTTAFRARLKSSFPAQAQYVAGLYSYVALTGDLALAREVWPTCLWILDRCREHVVGDTGLVSGAALWPDFPEAMEEDGADISSMNNSVLYQALRGVEYLAAALGDPALATECRDWSVRLRENFRRHLYDEQQGFFISSCSSVDFRPRRHYCAQSIFWLTPFAHELVSHAPQRIAAFMRRHLRSEKCLLTLPHWDTAWMADGNQLGSSFPAADAFYLGVNRLAGDETALKHWMGDIEWFWRRHTAPEAFTPEAENEHALGPDNTGTKQLQALTTWYAAAVHSVVGADFDHEGLTLTPCGSLPAEICGLEVRGRRLDLRVVGQGAHLAEIRVNGKPVSLASHKIAWDRLPEGVVRIDWIRSATPPDHPVILRTDGLKVLVESAPPSGLRARVSGSISGEIAIRADASARFVLDGVATPSLFNEATSVHLIPFSGGRDTLIEIIPATGS